VNDPDPTRSKGRRSIGIAGASGAPGAGGRAPVLSHRPANASNRPPTVEAIQRAFTGCAAPRYAAPDAPYDLAGRDLHSSCSAVHQRRSQPHIATMPHLDLTDAEAEALAQELAGIIDSARYPLSSRIQTLRAVLTRLRPERARPAASPESRVYASPSRGSYRKREG